MTLKEEDLLLMQIARAIIRSKFSGLLSNAFGLGLLTLIYELRSFAWAAVGGLEDWELLFQG